MTGVSDLGLLVFQNKTGVIAALAEVNSIFNALEQFLELQEAGVPFKENIESHLNRQDEFKRVINVFHRMLAFLASEKDNGVN